jgi:hypothetical protein
MKRILLFLLPLSLACVEKSNKSNTLKIQSNTLSIAVNNIKKVDTTLEFLDWNSLKINNRLPLLCKKSEIIELLGQPDSIVVPNMNDICVSYFEGEFKYIYFGKSQFETKGDKVVISSILFGDNNRVKINNGSIVLDNSMTIDKLASIFPNAVKLKYEVTLDMGEKAMCVRLETSKVGGDNAWVLLFQNGKLIRIDFWMPC